MSIRYLVRRFFLGLILLASLTGMISCAEEAKTGPRAWIDFPQDGASVPVGQPVSVISHAYAREGVGEVLLTVNGEPYRRDPSPQPGASFVKLSQEWLPQQEGVYTLDVRTYDVAGEAGRQSTINLRVVGAVAQGPTDTPTVVPPPPQDVDVTPTDTPTVVPPQDVDVTPTDTPESPTDTPTPVDEPTPTDTPTSCTPAQVEFRADQLSLLRGQCTMLRWDVENATAIYLNGEGVVGHDDREVCPTNTTTYNLHVESLCGNVDRSVTITVGEPQDTTPPPVPSPAVPADGLELSCRSQQILAWVPVNDESGGSVIYYVKLEIQVQQNWQSVRGWGPVSGKEVQADVLCGDIYRWTVRAQDEAGNVSDWSPWSHFTIGELQDTSPPPVPAPAVPADGLDLSCRSQQALVWVPVSDESGGSVIYYVKLEIQVQQDQWQSAGGWGPVSGKEVQAGVLCGGIYRWTVRAQDEAGNVSDWAPWSHFSISLD